MRTQAEAALAQNKMTLEKMRLLMKHYEDAMNSYTYLSE